MRISDWSSDVCSSDLRDDAGIAVDQLQHQRAAPDNDGYADHQAKYHQAYLMIRVGPLRRARNGDDVVQAHHEVSDDNRFDGGHTGCAAIDLAVRVLRSDEHTSELQSLMRISYAV